MGLLVWFTMGLAIWHFSIFVPDRFLGGIVGALVGSVAGAMIVGALLGAFRGSSLGDTDLLTVLVAVPGALLGLAVVYGLGVRAEERVRHQRA